MCGILAVQAIDDKDPLDILTYLQTLSNRGPDAIDSVQLSNIFLGFTRLSINDLTADGMQPMHNEDKSVWLICNGEIFNHKKIIMDHCFEPYSKSDCEVILHLYMQYRDCEHIENKFNNWIKQLDGEFAFVIYDSSKNIMLSCRDRYGVRPLFQGMINRKVIGYASEMKALTFCDTIHQVSPGTFEIVNITNDVTSYIYHSVFFQPSSISQHSLDQVLKNINNLFKKAVQKRLMSERPICCLLSGGLDSSLVSSIVASHFPPHTIHTFSIGLEGSPDLYYAKKVADYILSIHHEVIVTQEEFLNHIEETIKTIESYDTTSVRASVGNLLVSKYISDNTDFKVVFNGDYSDEVCGGYKYFKNAPSSFEFDHECKRLVSDICYFDSLRSDRTISSQGLEARVPFSDNDFVEYYLSIPIDMRMQPDKLLLRRAFENDGLLPDEILWRPKEAFSDGVSQKDNSWHTILKTHINKKITDKEFQQESNNMIINKPMLKETYYYRKIYNKYYEKYEDVIPYYWLPKWCNEVIDPSAREII